MDDQNKNLILATVLSFLVIMHVVRSCSHRLSNRLHRECARNDVTTQRHGH